MTLLEDVKENRLLASLPEADLQKLMPFLEPVSMPLGQVIYDSGDTLNHVYFPSTAVVSLLQVMQLGTPAQVSVVGNEGLIGIASFMGGDSSLRRAVVQVAGHGLRVNARTVQDQFDRSNALRHHFLRFTQALITQMFQTGACNRHHRLEQRFCRWLLLSLDRHPSGIIRITQDLVAVVLGVRREAVTEAVRRLKAAGVIGHTRGRIVALDRIKLEERCCECYRVVRDEYDRLLPGATLRTGPVTGLTWEKAQCHRREGGCACTIERCP